MSSRSSLTLLALAAMSVIVLGSCSTAPQPSTADSLEPPGDHRQARLAAAMAGLIFDRDQVHVDPAWEAGGEGVDVAAALLEQGRELIALGRRLQAIRAFTDAVLAAPDLAGPWEWLGRTLRAEHQYEHALAALSTALERDADRVEARFELASTLHSLARLDEAIAAWQEVVDRDPEHGPAHARLAAAYWLAENPALSGWHLVAARELGAPLPHQLEELLDHGVPHSADVQDGAEDGWVVIGSQVRIDVGGGAAASNETTAAALGTSPQEIVGGWNDYREPGVIRAGFGLSLDGGASWSDFLIRPPVANQADVEGDPMTARDERTGTLWVGAIAFGASGGVYVARKDPGTTTFQPAVMTIVDGGTDKGWLAAGPVPGSPDSTRLYVAYNYGLQYSDDMGDTWSSVRSLGGGLGFLPRIGPGGELYIAYWDGGYGVKMRRSFDGGDTIGPIVTIATRMDTWDDTNFPGDFRVPPLTALGVDPVDGTLYCAWFDTTGMSGGNANTDIYFSRSENQGDTWSTPLVINGDGIPPGDQFFPWLEVDSEGRVHLLFYDTRNTPQDDSDPNALIDAYYSVSIDRGDTWTEYRLTPAPFDTVYAPTFIGDYNGMAQAANRVYPVYMSTQNGNPDAFTHSIVWNNEPPLFADGFESGDTSGMVLLHAVKNALWWMANVFQVVVMFSVSALGIPIALLLAAVTGRRSLPLVLARRPWAPWMLWVAGIKLEVEGGDWIDSAEPLFFVANHQSIIDIPAVFAALPSDLHFIVKKELRRVPFLGWFIAATGMIFVDRKERIGSLTSARRAAELIRSGRSVMAFPEGTRSRSGEIQPFKSGAFIPAIEAGAAVVPIAIHGAGAVVPAGQFKGRPGTIRVIIGEAMPTEGLSVEDRRTLAVQARERVLELHEQLE